MIGGRQQVIPVKEIKVKVSTTVNQDATAILITRIDEDGKQFYVSNFEWSSYQGFDLLDITEVSTTATVRVMDRISEHVTLGKEENDE